MMKRLSLLFTRFFSEVSGAGGAPGGRAGPGGSPQPRAPKPATLNPQPYLGT